MDKMGATVNVYTLKDGNHSRRFIHTGYHWGHSVAVLLDEHGGPKRCEYIQHFYPQDHPFPDKIENQQAIVFLKSALKMHSKDCVFRDYILALLEDCLYIEMNRRYQRAIAMKIYRAWWDARSNPYHPLGKKRLLKEFEDLVSA
jgi:hypothetical protein